jgi:hypothetical protein
MQYAQPKSQLPSLCRLFCRIAQSSQQLCEAFNNIGIHRAFFRSDIISRVRSNSLLELLWMVIGGATAIRFGLRGNAIGFFLSVLFIFIGLIIWVPII